MLRVAETTMAPSALGRMWRMTIFIWPEPIARAASTYSFSRTESTTERMIRAVFGQAVRPMARMITVGVWPKLAAIRISRKMVGIERMASVKRIRKLSSQPPA